MAYPSDLVRTKNWGTEVLTDSDLEGQFDLIINWLMAAFNSSTGHTHSGSGNNGPLLSSSAVTTTFGNGFTTVTGASGDYLLIASDVSDSNKTKKALASDFIFTPSSSNALAGSVVQTVNVCSSASSTGTTTIPFDNTIPQNTEGDECMTLAITPTSATNKLLIRAIVHGGTSSNNLRFGVALFQDTTADALAAGASMSVSANQDMLTTVVEHYMTAGTTSATTFKIRAGCSSAGTFTFNGSSSARLFGGVTLSSITIQEIKV